MAKSLYMSALLLTLIPFRTNAQAQEVCEPGYFEAVDDYFEIALEEISSTTYNVLDNDFIAVDYWELIASDMPPCFNVNQDGTVEINSSSAAGDGTGMECCGEHFFTYTLLGENNISCSAEVTIIIACEEDSKSDCSIIDLSDAALTDPDDSGNNTEGCVPVCGGALTTVTYPLDPYAYYNYSVIGGAIQSAPNQNEILVLWDAYAGQGSVVLELIDDAGTQIITQCVDIMEPPKAIITVDSIACLNSTIQFFSDSHPSSADHFWEFGDGTTSTMVNPVHTYTSPGLYDATLTVTAPVFNDSGVVVCCCTDVAAVTMEIMDTEGPKMECRSTLCAGDSACYSTPSGCPSAQYAWEAYDSQGNSVAIDGNGSPEICVEWGDGPAGTVQLSIYNCPDLCDIPTTVEVPIVSTQSLVDGPAVVCENQVATYAVPKWMDVEYDWVISGAQSYAINDNEVTVIWGGSGFGTIEVYYESQFLLQVDDHEAPDCSGFGNLDVSILPEFKFTVPTSGSGCTAYSSYLEVNSDAIWSVSPYADMNVSGFSCTIDWPGPGIYTVTAHPSDPNGFCNDYVSHTIVITELEEPSIQGPGNGCAGEPMIYFIDNPEGNAFYSWYASGGTVLSSSGTSATVEWYAGATNQTLTVYANQTISPFCSATQSISFYEDLPQTPSIQGSLTVCANSTADYTVGLTSIQPGETFTWTVSPPEAGNIISPQGEPNCTVQWGAGAVMATVHATSNVCGLTESDIISVAIQNPSTPSITQSGLFCSGGNQSNVTLTGTSGYISYNWTSPNGASSNSMVYTAVEAGMHELEVTDAYGCEANAYFEVHEWPGPTASISSPHPNAICLPAQPTTIDLFTLENPNWQYNWNGGPSGPSTISHAIQNVPGTYTYNVQVTDPASGCTASDSFSIVEDNCTGGPGGGTGGGGCTPSEPLNLTLTQSCDYVEVIIGATSALNAIYDFGDNSPWTSSSDNTYDAASCYVISVNAEVTDANDPNETCSITEEIGVCIPVAAAFNHATISCFEVQFNDLSSYLQNPNPNNSITQWQWDFGDGTTSNQQNPSHAYSSPGLYDVTLTVTDASGCTAATTQHINLSSVGIPSLSYDGTVCVGGEELYSTSATNAVHYSWTFPDGLEIEGESEISYAMTEPLPPVYNEIEITAYDVLGCSNSQTFILNVVNPPALTLDTDPNPGIVCPDPGIALLTASPSNFTSYQWLDDNGSGLNDDAYGVPIDPTMNHVSVHAGTYTVEAEYQGCSVESNAVLVQTWQEEEVYFSGPTLLCGDGTATYVYNGFFNNPTWYVDGAIAASNQAAFDYYGAAPHLVEIRLEVTDINGCIHSSNPMMTQWESGVSFDLFSQNAPPCAGSEVTIEVSNLVAISPIDFSWNTGQNAPEIQTWNAGTYTCTGYDAAGCSHTETFEVFPTPDLCTVPSGCYSSCDPVDICGPGNLSSYQWHFNGSAIPGEIDSCTVLNQSGNYALTASNNFGCYSTSNTLEFTLEDCACDVAFSAQPTGNDCCQVISFQNNSNTSLNILDFHTPGVMCSFSLIDPDYSIDVLDPMRITVSHNGGNIPSGGPSDIITICPDSPGTNAVVVEISMRLDSLDVCGDEIWFECETDTLDCEPLECNGTLYQVFGDNGQVGSFNPFDPGSWTTLPFNYDDGNNDPTDIEDSMNAVGYNELDNYAYGFARNGDDDIVLVRIGANGCVVDLGQVENHPLNTAAQDLDFHPTAGTNLGALKILPDQGDFTKINQADAVSNVTAAWTNAGIPLPPGMTFHLLHIRHAENDWVNVVDVVTRTVVHTYFLTGNASQASQADFALRHADGRFYGVDEWGGRLVWIDPSDGTTDYVGAGFGGACNNWGAAYTDINGSIFCTCNSFWGLQTPNTYQIDPTTGVGTPIFDTNTGPLTRNDGFSCPSASISEPTACMTILVESVECTPVEYGYDVNFEVCNNPNSNFEIGYFSVSVSNDMNAQISPSVFDLGVGAIQPADCQTFSFSLLDFESEDELCLIVSAHENDPTVNPETMCCIAEACFPMPACDAECATVEWFEVECLDDQWYFEAGILNNSMTTVGYVEFIYPGINGLISDINSVGAVPHGDLIAFGDLLSPFTDASSPFCIDVVLHEASPLGELVECCSFEYCMDLPPCGPEEIPGCMDSSASNFNPEASFDDGSCSYCIAPALINTENPCGSEIEEVCGCNGITYINLCYAINMGGVISWTPGICGNSDSTSSTETNDETCPTDVNEDGTTNVSDLLLVLGEFGIQCE